MFDIREFVQFNAKNRAICPACAAMKGSDYKATNLALVPGTDGAYKCHRGCTPEDIRAAIGQEKERVIPTRLAQPTPPAKVTVSPQKVREAHDRLMDSDGPAKQWLHNRGIDDGLIQRHQLGVTRAKVGDRHLPAISIPIPANTDGTQFFQKKRIAPWLSEGDRPAQYSPWSQYGIPPQVFFTWLPAEAQETWLCEGEWDAMVMGKMLREGNAPIACATFTCGAGNVPSPEQLALLPGTVAIFYDRNDAPMPNGKIPGDEGAKKVALALGDRGRIALVPMADDCPVQGWDVSNAIAAGFTLTDFTAAAVAAVAPPQSATATTKANPLKARLVSNDDMIARAPDYVEWLIPDLLTVNELFVLAAPPRGGKSLLAMSLAKAIATGENFLDRPVMKGSVLYVNLEDSEAKLKERQQAQGWGSGLPVYWLDQFKLNELPYLIELADGIEALRLIVLDTLSRIRCDGTSEGAAEMGMVIEPLQELAKRKNICILVIHHTKKMNADQATDIDVFDSIRGSGAIRATARGSLIIAAGQECYRLLAENGHGKHDLRIRQDLTSLEWKLLGKWSPSINLDQKEVVLDFMNRVGSATLEQIFEGTQIPKRSLYMVLARLCADKMLSKEGQQRSAVYIRPVQRVQQLNSLLNSQDADSVSAKGLSSTKNNSSLTASKSDHLPKSDHRTDANNDHFSPNDHFLEGYQFVELGNKKVLNPDRDGVSAVQQQFNKTPFVELKNKGGDHGSDSNSDHVQVSPVELAPKSDHPELSRGDMVEILSAGQYQGKRGRVQGRKYGGFTVKGRGWKESVTYAASDLRKLEP